MKPESDPGKTITILDDFLNGFHLPKKVLLVRVPTINFATFDINHHKKVGYGTHPPISIAALAASCRNKCPSINLELLDLEYVTLRAMFAGEPREDIQQELFLQAVKSFRPDWIGLSVVFSPAAKNGYRLNQLIREEYEQKVPILWGGVHATFDYQKILSKGADFVLLNEADLTLPALIQFAHDRSHCNGLHGIAFRNSGGTFTIPFQSQPDFAKLPRPAWEMVDDFENYYKATQICGLKNVIEEPMPTAIIQTVRGCIARCTFCSVRNFNGRGVRTRSVTDVLNELEFFCKTYGVKYVEVVDDDFTADLPRAKQICDGIIERKLEIIWSLDNGIRILTIDEELAEKLVASGCRLISVGVESGNAKILHKIKKPLKLDGLHKKMAMLRAYPEIYVKGNFIVGFPFEAYSQIQDTFDLINNSEFDWKIISIYSPLVGTDSLAYFDDEARNEIEYAENNYGKAELLPDGYNSKEEFESEIYINNLRSNFLLNPNYLGHRAGPPRAIKDFSNVANNIDPEHAVAHLCLSKLYQGTSSDLARHHFDLYNEIKDKSRKWQYYLGKLGLIDSGPDLGIKDLDLDRFRSGREMDGERFA